MRLSSACLVAATSAACSPDSTSTKQPTDPQDNAAGTGSADSGTATDTSAPDDSADPVDTAESQDTADPQDTADSGDSGTTDPTARVAIRAVWEDGTPATTLLGRLCGKGCRQVTSDETGTFTWELLPEGTYTAQLLDFSPELAVPSIVVEVEDGAVRSSDTPTVLGP